MKWLKKKHSHTLETISLWWGKKWSLPNIILNNIITHSTKEKRSKILYPVVQVLIVLLCWLLWRWGCWALLCGLRRPRCGSSRRTGRGGSPPPVVVARWRRLLGNGHFFVLVLVIFLFFDEDRARRASRSGCWRSWRGRACLDTFCVLLLCRSLWSNKFVETWLPFHLK
jgi:hypothetical protein